MVANTPFDALSFLLGGSQTVACGTWFLIEGNHLPEYLRGKTRSVVASTDCNDGGVVVFFRSASRQIGVSHSAHVDHECAATAAHKDVRRTFSAHPCHIDKEGWVDLDTPFPLGLDVLEGHRMCFEDESTVLLTILEEGRS